MNVLAFDPDSHRYPWALVQAGPQPKYLDQGIIKGGSSKIAHTRLMTLYHQLEDFLVTRWPKGQDPDAVIIEIPDKATKEKTTIPGLAVQAVAVGQLFGLCHARWGTERVHPVNASEWTCLGGKRPIPKPSRLEMHARETGYRGTLGAGGALENHTIDARMMAAWWIQEQRLKAMRAG